MAGSLEPIVEGEDVRVVVTGSDGLSVWCATARSALLNVSVTPDLGVLRSRVDTEYGLPSESLFAMLSTGSRLLLGTNRGLVEYDPGRGAPNLGIVRVLGRRPYTQEEWAALRLDYPQNSLLVQAAAVGSRTYPERFQYAFSLEDGKGRSVSHTLSRDGQFAAESLQPGRYRVAARAFGTNLVASAPVTLDFEVAGAPIPWPSIALAALLACALLALGWGAAQYRRLRAASVALSETRLQLVQETENERRRIARDLHDQTLADLRGLLIALPASVAGAAAVRDDVEAISSEVRRICEDLSPSVLENVSLTAALEWALDETVRRRPKDEPLRGSFACSDDLADRLSLEPVAEIQIYRIVQEALANAARHSGARELRLTVDLSPDRTLVITLDDDGRGFDAESAHQGRGLSNIRSRASLIGAQVEWRRRDEGGTRFTLRKARETRA
jgi:signal transduction histidine kinase